jgi:hypothetical protein
MCWTAKNEITTPEKDIKLHKDPVIHLLSDAIAISYHRQGGIFLRQAAEFSIAAVTFE